MPDEIELSPVDFITIGTIGPAGKRTFHLQARRDEVLLTLIIEKAQAAAIAESVVTMLDQIKQEFNVATPEVDLTSLDLDLEEPILPLFRVGQLGLGYDKDSDLVILLAGELLPQDALEEPRIARFGATRQQMRALAQHTATVVAAGRPICGNCGQPIDPDGHYCPKSNGHRKPVVWA